MTMINGHVFCSCGREMMHLESEHDNVFVCPSCGEEERYGSEI